MTMLLKRFALMSLWKVSKNTLKHTAPQSPLILKFLTFPGAQTIMVPNVYDPSELRSDVNGKVQPSWHFSG